MKEWGWKKRCIHEQNCAIVSEDCLKSKEDKCAEAKRREMLAELDCPILGPSFTDRKCQAPGVRAIITAEKTMCYEGEKCLAVVLHEEQAMKEFKRAFRMR